MADHGNKCYVPGCAGDVSTLHTLPTEHNCQQAWLMFVYNRIPRQFNSKLLVCSAHFTLDSFSNRGQYQAGFAQRLILKKGAIPTILPHATAPQPLRTYDVGCQTDAPALLCKGTQLPPDTWMSHIQSRVSSQSVAVGTTTTGLSRAAVRPFIPATASTPAKRARVELEEDGEMRNISSADPLDFATSLSFHKDAKFIVSEKCLLGLFESCPVCTRVCVVRSRRRGTFVAVDQRCPHCAFFRQWRSQPVVGSTPVGDLQLSAAVCFSGASFLKMQKVFRAMNLKTHTYEAFRRHARTFLEPAIVHKWKEEQNLQLRRLSQNKSVVLGGDMRADSPGRSAKYGSYTMMNLQTNSVIDIQLVQSSEVGGSCLMEKEGLRRSLDLLEERGVKLDCVVTDCRPQIQAFLKERKINHCYDVWHMVKKLSKKVEKMSREEHCSLVKKWRKSITNHLYWSAISSDSGPETVAKWTSIINHIQDIHTHSDPAFPSCQHELRVSKDRRKWFQPGSTALNRLRKLLMNKRVLSDVKKLSPRYQTSAVESFHKVFSRFAPKNVVLPFTRRLCRLLLAAMHFNENASRLNMTSRGKLVHKLLSPKSQKRGPAVKPGKTEPTFCYVANLMNTVFEEVVRDPIPYLDAVQRLPPDPSAPHDRSSPCCSVEEGLNPSYGPAASRNSLGSSTPEGPTTLNRSTS